MECKASAVTTSGDRFVVFVEGVNKGRAKVG
jgi:hypothetical protein